MDIYFSVHHSNCHPSPERIHCVTRVAYSQYRLSLSNDFQRPWSYISSNLFNEMPSYAEPLSLKLPRLRYVRATLFITD